MRHLYLALNEEELAVLKVLKKYTTEGYSLAHAAFYAGVNLPRASLLLSREKVTKAELKERRKNYIVSRLTDNRVSHRHTPHVISSYFGVLESYVEYLIRELRAEGRLPPSDSKKDREEEILSALRKRYPNVYRSATVGKLYEVGNKVYVAGKGWLSWAEAEALAISVAR